MLSPKPIAMLVVDGTPVAKDVLNPVAECSSMMGADLMCGEHPCRADSIDMAVKLCQNRPLCVGGIAVQYMRKTKVTLKMEEPLSFSAEQREHDKEIQAATRLSVCQRIRDRTRGAPPLGQSCSAADQEAWRAHGCLRFTPTGRGEGGGSEQPRAPRKAGARLRSERSSAHSLARSPSCVRLVLGIFSTAWEFEVQARWRRLLRFRDHAAAGPWGCGLNPLFVVGEPAPLASGDTVVLPTAENMDRGKSLEWLAWVARHATGADAVIKMDADTQICPDALSAAVGAALRRGAHYFGYRINGSTLVGGVGDGLTHCMPSPLSPCMVGTRLRAVHALPTLAVHGSHEAVGPVCWYRCRLRTSCHAQPATVHEWRNLRALAAARS